MRILIASDSINDMREAVASLLRIGFPATVDATLLGIPLTRKRSFVSGVVLGTDEGRVSVDVTETDLSREATRLQQEGWAVRTKVATGKAVDEIIRTAQQLGIDLVVLAACRPNRVRQFRFARKIMRHTRCSVLSLANTTHHNLDRSEETESRDAVNDSGLRILVVSFDSTPPVVEFGNPLALQLEGDTNVAIVTVLPLIRFYRMDIIQQLSPLWQERKRASRESMDVWKQSIQSERKRVTTQVLEGYSESREILKAASRFGADIIVARHPGPTEIHQFQMFNVTSRLLRDASCSVWLERK
jgi:nucleotide-binding universal stress UspA family protein